MNYIEMCNQFWIVNKESCFKPSEISLYFHLLDVSNSLAWKNPFKQSNLVICATIGCSEPVIQRSREKLVKAGLIAFKSGTRKGELTEYRLINLGIKKLYLSSTQSDHLSNTQSEYRSNGKPFDINKHKQNKTKIKKDMPHSGPIESDSILEEEEKKKEKDSAQKERNIYQEFLAIYDDFIKIQTNCPSKIDGVQGNAAKRIIAYLKNASNDKSDDGALNSWKYILANWNKIENFYRDKLKLSEIDSNMINIIGQLKNGRQNSKTGKSESATYDPAARAAELFNEFNATTNKQQY